ncbi:MAG: proline hydroxylase [Legionellales bacterium]|nr:proline hydroxylase [Legionellales bacterium]
MNQEIFKYINVDNFCVGLNDFSEGLPFPSCVVDDFFHPSIARELLSEFPAFDSKIWHQYDNAIEIKKVCNNWNVFPETTYKVFSLLNSKNFIDIIEKNLGGDKKLYPDIGLNGGGWHIHGRGGLLNTHLDYSLHPKLKLQRKLNLIVYLNEDWKESWGGGLGFWGNESPSEPGELKRKISPIYNRAVLFDTTQNSWHGLPEAIKCPANHFRKSLAVYYLCPAADDTDQRGKALFSARADQKGDLSVAELIKKRASVDRAGDVYR